MESSLSRHELLKKLKTHKRYKNKTQKEISEKFGSIDNLRKELNRIETKKPKIEKIEPVDSHYMSAKKVLSTILLNSDTTLILDEYIISYLKLNPHLVTQYLDKNGLYYVYYRFRDSNTNPFIPEEKAIEPILIKSFGTENEAKLWILEYGKEIIELQEDNWRRPIVITVIYDTNDGDTENPPAHEHGISDQMYETYVFSQGGYKMVTEELEYNNNDRTPKWIHYIK